MARVYDRQTRHYSRATIDHLVETGQARYYPAQGGIYVIKTESGTVAVRSHQIINLPPVTAVVESVEVFPSQDTPPAVAAPATTSWVSGDEAEEILKHFGI